MVFGINSRKFSFWNTRWKHKITTATTNVNYQIQGHAIYLNIIFKILIFSLHNKYVE